MHLDDVLLEIGDGIFQWFIIATVSLAVFSEGLLSSAAFFILPQVSCEIGVEWEYHHHIYASFVIGSLVGSYWLGGVSDVTGRRYALSLSSIISFICAFLTVFAQSQLLLSISFCLLGMSLAGVYASCRVICMEMLPKTVRGSRLVLLDLVRLMGCTFPIGLMYGVWSEKHNFRDFLHLPLWRHILVIGAILAMWGACLLLLVPVSPRQMLAQQRIVSASIILRRIFAINRNKHEDNYPNYVFDAFTFIETRMSRMRQCSDYFLFTLRCMWSYLFEMMSPPLLCYSAVLLLCHICIMDKLIFFNGLLAQQMNWPAWDCKMFPQPLNTTNFEIVCAKSYWEGDNFLNNLLLICSPIPAIIALVFLVDSVPRKAIFGFSSFFCAVASMLLAYVPEYKTSFVAVIVLYAAFTICSTILDIITLETYPSKFRSTAFGFMKMTARLTLLVVIFFIETPCHIIFEILAYAFLLATAISFLLRNVTQSNIVE